MAKIILNPNETELYKAIYAAYCKEVGIERGPTDLIPEDDRDWVHYDEQGNLVWVMDEKLFEFMANNLITNMPFYVSFWKKIVAINELIRTFVKTHMSTYMDEFVEKFGAIEREFSKYAFERKLKLKTTDELLALQKEAQTNLEEVAKDLEGDDLKDYTRYYESHLQSIAKVIADRVSFIEVSPEKYQILGLYTDDELATKAREFRIELNEQDPASEKYMVILGQLQAIQDIVNERAAR